MEILSTNTFTEAAGLGLLITIMFVIIGVAGIFVMCAGIFDGDIPAFLVGLTMTLVGVFAIWAFGDIGEIEYVEKKVIIEDYNVVHEQGYEIIDTDGKITTIRKEVGNDGNDN